MSVYSHNFAYTDGEQPVTLAVREALAARFSVVPASRARTLRRTWLDTFDWRLHRAGPHPGMRGRPRARRTRAERHGR